MTRLFGTSPKMFLIAILVGWLACAANAQNAQLELFEGGSMDVGLGFRSHLLSGAGASGATAGFIAPLNPDPFVIFGNPAALTRIDGRKASFSSSPTINFDLSTLMDPAPEIKTRVDESLTSFDMPSDITYPKVSGTFGRSGSLLSGFAVSLPIGEEDEKWFGGRVPKLVDAVGFGYYEPFALHMSFIYGGLRTRMRTIEDTPESEIVLFSSIKTDMDLLFTTDCWNLSAAKGLGDLTLGVGVQRTGGRMELHGNMRTDGIMSKAGTENSFNDPNSPWDDDYYSLASGSFGGAGWGTRIGVIYDAGGDFIFGALARLQKKMTLDGQMDLETHNFKALRLNAPEGEDQFDVNRIEVVSELTRTTSKIFETSDKLYISIPQEISIAASYYGKFKPNLTLTKYFGELAYEYDMREDGAPFHYKRGYKPDWGVMLGLDLSFIQVGLGATRMQDVVAGYHDARGNPIAPAPALIVPRLNIGFNTGLSEHLNLGVLVYGLPEDFLRLTLEYSL